MQNPTLNRLRFRFSGIENSINILNYKLSRALNDEERKYYEMEKAMANRFLTIIQEKIDDLESDDYSDSDYSFSSEGILFEVGHLVFSESDSEYII